MEGPALFLSPLNTQQTVCYGVNTGRREVVSSLKQCPVHCSKQPEGMRRCCYAVWRWTLASHCSFTTCWLYQLVLWSHLYTSAFLCILCCLWGATARYWYLLKLTAYAYVDLPGVWPCTCVRYLHGKGWALTRLEKRTSCGLGAGLIVLEHNCVWNVKPPWEAI